MKLTRIVALAILVVTGLGCTTSARGAFPGTNGSIAYVVEGPEAERLVESAFLGPEGTLEPDSNNLKNTGVDRGGDAFGPSLGGDGRNLAFVSTRSGRRQIYSIGLNFSRSLVSFCGMEVCPLTSGLAESYEPAWSSNGQSIVFTSNREGSAQIYRMTATGEAATRLTFDNATDQEPTWSQTGKIAFVSDLTGSPEIYVMNGRGEELRQITQSGVNISPVWAPNSQELAYAGETATGYQIFTIDLAGGEPRRLTGATPESRQPAWSPDGAKLLLTRGPNLSGGSYLEVINARSGTPVSPRGGLGTGEDGNWGPLPPAPPRHAPPATAGLTAIARPISGKVGINPGHALGSAHAGEASPPALEALTPATPASILTESVEVPVNSTYDATQGVVKLTVASRLTSSMSTAVVRGGRFLLIQHGSTAIPTIRLVGHPRGCGRGRGRGRGRGHSHDLRQGPRARTARRHARSPHVRAHTKGPSKEDGEYGSGSSPGTRWEISNTCRGTLYRAIEDTVTVTDPHRRRPIRVTSGHQYLVRPGRR